MAGCRTHCWFTGTRHYHEHGCPNASREESLVAAALASRLAESGIRRPGPARQPPRPRFPGWPTFISAAESAWYGIAEPNCNWSPAAKVLLDLIKGTRVSDQRLIWAFQHAKYSSVVRELLEARLQARFGMTGAAVLERQAHG